MTDIDERIERLEAAMLWTESISYAILVREYRIIELAKILGLTDEQVQDRMRLTRQVILSPTTEG